MEESQSSGFETKLNASHLSAYQITVIALCAIVAMIDGFDTQSVALVAPQIASAWGVDSSSFGPVFGAGLFGGMIGALLLGRLGDRFGRKPALLLSILSFGIAAIATAFTSSMAELTAARFATGIGLGGALPCIIAITAEYAPRRIRATAVAMMYCGFPMGAFVGGIISSKAIPLYGWTSVFYVGGLIPLLLLPLFALVMPESIGFLTLRKDLPRMSRILTKMKWSDAAEDLLISAPAAPSMPFSSLFTEGRAIGSIFLAATIFCSLMFTYFLINWIPIVTVASGIPVESAILGVAMLNIGAITGCILIGRLADRRGLVPVVGTGFAIGAVAIGAIGMAGQSSLFLLVTAFAAGFFAIGAQMCTLALCANYYKTALRTTGVGWIMGTGRIGAIGGPILGGVLLGAGMLMPTLFLIAGAVSLSAATMIFVFGRLTAKSEAAAG